MEGVDLWVYGLPPYEEGIPPYAQLTLDKVRFKPLGNFSRIRARPLSGLPFIALHAGERTFSCRHIKMADMVFPEVDFGDVLADVPPADHGRNHDPQEVAPD